jgi:uncharacterized membrane protein
MTTTPHVAAITAEPGPGGRVAAIDALRGIVMILMALDHVRDFVHRAAMSSSPTDLATTTPVLFMTRWVTHLCAPVFMFTAGLGAFFWWNNRKTKNQLSVFLLTRGLWLVILELTVMRLAYNFTFSRPYPYFLLVLWVLGVCMIGMAALVRLPIRWLAVGSVAMLVLHNLLDGVSGSQLGLGGWWNVIHQPGVFRLAGRIIIVGYPVVPWISVMALGFCFGRVLLLEPAVRRRFLVRIGTALTLGFVLVRALNRYGDPVAWSVQGSPVYTLLSFLNTSKYPPSLDFLLMTLGPALLALAWLDRRGLSRANPLCILGRVPLFYFVLHFYAAHLVAALLALLKYGSPALGFLFHPVPSMGGPRELFPPGFGYDLWVVYAVWALVVVGIYPACRWFAKLKERRRDWWLSYL